MNSKTHYESVISPLSLTLYTQNESWRICSYGMRFLMHSCFMNDYCGTKNRKDDSDVRQSVCLKHGCSSVLSVMIVKKFEIFPAEVFSYVLIILHLSK